MSEKYRPLQLAEHSFEIEGEARPALIATTLAMLME